MKMQGRTEVKRDSGVVRKKGALNEGRQISAAGVKDGEIRLHRL